MKINTEIKVVELFAGVGGFRLGLENSSSCFKTIWANQWEPDAKKQYAFDCYIHHFGINSNYTNVDIALAKDEIPKHDLLVGGFPCQDYSVARTGAKGIEGKKGVLWWEIDYIIKKCKPPYILLENVDRLIKSPSAQRGRDFSIILRCLYDTGYAVEWRVINAADYGNAQKRRRVFIFAYKNSTNLFRSLSDDICKKEGTFVNYIFSNGFFAKTFPVQQIRNEKKSTEIGITQIEYNDLSDISDNFSAHFYNSGIMINGRIYSEETIPQYIEPISLEKILHKEKIDERYFLNGSLEKWKFLKGSKKIPRIRPNGEAYVFSEGAMCFPDHLDKPARTMLTSESSVNRSSHVVKDIVTGKLRLLTPVECERLNGFNDDWTNTGMPEKFRYFVMGNALVVPLITKMGDEIKKYIDN